MSRSIGEPLSNDAAQHAAGAFYVINTERDALIVAEIELGEIPLQVLLADVMVDAVDTALQYREVALNGIGVGVAANVFLGGVINGLVAREALAGFQVDSALIGAQMRLVRNLFFDDRLHISRVDIRNMEGRDAALALDQRDDWFVARQLLCVSPVLRLAADIGFIGLHEFSFAAQAAGQLTFAHGLANTMAHKPCGFESDAKGPVKLVAAHSLLGRAEQEHCLQPDMQLYMASFEDGPDLDGEGLAASVALIDTDPRALALQRAALVYHAAMRAEAAARPDMRLDEGVGGFFAVVLRLGQDGHWLSPWNLI